MFDEPIPFDLKGQARINRCAVDIGAYEAQVPPLNPPVWDAQNPNLGPKNRYFSFVHDQNPGEQTAVRVTFAEPPPEYWDDLEGRVLWVGEPAEITEASGSDGPEPPPKFWAATLQCGPFYTDWSVYDRVDVYDDAIMPGSTFELDTILSAPECKVTEEYGFSAPTPISTASEWGDVVGDCGVTPCTVPQGAVDFEDITAVVDKFSNDPDAAIKSRADLINSNVTDPEPDRIVDFLDVTFCVDAFRGFQENPNSYPGPNLSDFDCPPYVGDCYADIRVDSNNDGDIDDFDDPIEDMVAMDVSANGDDDNGNTIPDMNEAPVDGEDDLAEMRVSAPCDALPEFAWWSLSWDPGAPLDIWFDPDKSGDVVVNEHQYTDYWPPPESVWLEFTDTCSEVDFTFMIDDGTSSIGKSLAPARQQKQDEVKGKSACTWGKLNATYYNLATELGHVAEGVRAGIQARDVWLCSSKDKPSSSAAWTALGERPTRQPAIWDRWVQMGFAIRKEPGASTPVRFWYVELRKQPGGQIPRAEWQTTNIVKAGYWITHEGNEWKFHLQDDSHRDFPATFGPDWNWNPTVNTLATWRTEIWHKEDQVMGVHGTPCEFYQCALGVDGDWISPDFKEQFAISEDDDQWSITVVGPESLEVYDKIPQQAP